MPQHDQETSVQVTAVHEKSSVQTAAEIHYDAALDKIAAGESAAASELFRECLAIDPTMLDAMHGLMRALQDTGQLDEAAGVAYRLIQLDPDDILAHTSLSILYQRKGMIPEAEAEAARARVLGWKLQLRQGEKPNMDL